MFQRYLFSSPGCGWAECTDRSHWIMLQAAIYLDPASHEGWRLAVVDHVVPMAVIV